MKKILLVAVITLLHSGLLFAQRMSEKSIQVIEKAMTDELDRSKEKLKLAGLIDPFYISYSATDNYRADISASFGALTRSNESRGRALNLRLMVGDYQLNDENFQDNSGGIFGGGGPQIDLNLPLDDDYDVIRRGFWLATDDLFKDANETFTKKKAALERKQLSDEDKDLPDFAKAPVASVIEPPKELNFDKKAVENSLKEISALFSKFPEIQNCQVAFSYNNSYQLYKSTEGTSFRKPQTNCDITIQASAQAIDDGEPMGLSLVFSALTPSEQNFTKIKAEAEKMAANLAALIRAPKYNDKEYTGPVMFEGDASPDFLADHLISKFPAQREDVLGGNVVMSFGNKGASFQKKISTRVLPVSVSVRDVPSLKTKDGMNLLGAYSIDDEGVKPLDLTLVDKGILKTIYTTRTPTKEVKESNGHARSGTNPAPGVVEITNTKAVASAAMRKDLFRRAKEDGYTYAFIVRSTKRAPLLFTDGMGSIDDLLSGEKAIVPALVYKVDIATGKEELVRGLEISFPTPRDLRELITSKETATLNTNLPSGGQGGFFSFGGAKVPATLIGPTSILVPELEARKKKTNANPTRPVVSRPN
jgi:predicted Zn-dependent protease